MWRVADLDEEYVAKMEDVLEVYERPYDPEQPVVCVERKAGYIARRCPADFCGRTRSGSQTGQRIRTMRPSQCFLRG